MKSFFQKILAPIGVSPMLKNALSVFVYGGVPVAGVIVSVVLPSDEVFRKFGEVAQLGLVAILFIKPLARILPSRFLTLALMYRRQMGVAVFWLALFHGVGYMYLYGLLNPGDFFGWGNFLLYGILGLLALLVLALTSNDISVRFFRSNWKRIQFLAYPTLFLVLLHSSMVEDEMMKFFVVGGVFIVLKLLEVRRFRLDTYLPMMRKWKI